MPGMSGLRVRGSGCVGHFLISRHSDVDNLAELREILLYLLLVEAMGESADVDHV
jgi:hypothetical protein